MRKTIPFLRSEYFHDAVQRTVFDEIASFITKYNQCPTQESLSIDLSKKNLTEDIFKGSVGLINELAPEEPATELQWLCDQTEQFCQDKAVYNSIRERYHNSYLMPFQSPLIRISDMTMSRTLKQDLIGIIKKKRRSNLTSITSTR